MSFFWNHIITVLYGTALYGMYENCMSLSYIIYIFFNKIVSCTVQLNVNTYGTRLMNLKKNKKNKKILVKNN